MKWTDLYTDFLFWPSRYQNQIKMVRAGLSRLIIDMEPPFKEPFGKIGTARYFTHIGGWTRDMNYVRVRYLDDKWVSYHKDLTYESGGKNRDC